MPSACYEVTQLAMNDEKSDYPAYPPSSTGDIYGAAKVLAPNEQEEEEDTGRESWSGQLDFLLSCLGYAVGLGNVWRFPYLCYRNGGGAFLIPFIIMLIFVGMPIFFSELLLGQFTSSGPLTCWKFAPLFTGLGGAMVVVSSLVAIYYNVIIAWSLYYLFVSFTSELPWANCDKVQYLIENRPNLQCSIKPVVNVSCDMADQLIHYRENFTCYNQTVNGTFFHGYTNVSAYRFMFPSEIYWERNVLRMSDGVETIGTIKWEMALCLLLAWAFVFLCLAKGVKTSGKVVYFTALFPYVVLFILAIRAFLLDGHMEGIKYYITPQWHRLAHAEVWNDAAKQIFFSLSASWGGLMTLSSYNKFTNNCFRDTMIVCLSNSATGIFAGFIIFAILGFMAKSLGANIEDVVDSGPGLAFTVYPHAVTSIPVAPLWSILFFLMLLTLGVDSQFVLVETVTTSIIDRFEKRLRPIKPWVILAVCAFFFLLGLIFCTEGGIYLFQLIDDYSGGWNVFLTGFIECVAIFYIYGWNRFSQDVECMLGRKPYIWWRICWQFFTPIIIVGLMAFGLAKYQPSKLGKNYRYPLWADGIGWIISCSGIVTMIIISIYYAVTMGFWQSLKPTVDWGPAKAKHRALVARYVPDYVVHLHRDHNVKLPSMITTLPTLATSPQFAIDNSNSNNSDKEYANKAFVIE